jgi:PAS domain S-box-containing protein
VALVPLVVSRGRSPAHPSDAGLAGSSDLDLDRHLDREAVGALADTVAQLELALEAGRMGTWQWSLATGDVTWSATLEHLYGFQPGTFPGTFESYTSRIHPDDRALAVANIERAMADRARFTYAYRIVRPDGAVRWIEGAGTPMVDGDEVVGMTGVCVDATARHDVEQHLRRERDLVATLNRVGQAVTSRLELPDVVQEVTDSATALTGADVGAFFTNLVDDEGTSYELVSVSGPCRDQFAGMAMPRATALFEPTFEGRGVVRLDDVTADARFGRNAPHHGMPPGHLGVRSYLAAPVVLADGEVAGGMLFGHLEPARFTELDARLVGGIAIQAAIAIDNSRRYERERSAAHTLQRALLPRQLPDLPGHEVAVRYQPGVDGIDVGGDWYDVVPLDDDRTLLVVGDVVGRGIGAAAIMGALRHSTRAHALDGDGPAEILRKLARVVQVGHDDQFATMWCARYDRRRGELVVANAGHPPPVLVAAGRGAALAHTPVGVPVGVGGGAAYIEGGLSLEPGDRLFVYTDGLVERRGEHLDAGFERLLAAVGATSGLALDDQLAALLAAMADGEPSDDTALLALHRLG